MVFFSSTSPFCCALTQVSSIPLINLPQKVSLVNGRGHLIQNAKNLKVHSVQLFRLLCRASSLNEWYIALFSQCRELGF